MVRESSFGVLVQEMYAFTLACYKVGINKIDLFPKVRCAYFGGDLMLCLAEDGSAGRPQW